MKCREDAFSLQDTRSAPIDGLRGIACLLVVVGHFFLQTYATQINHFSPLLASWAEKFAWGVNLFFVISGFLIGGILLDHRPTPEFRKAFYLRRIARIWPLYYFLILIVVAAQYSVAKDSFHATLAPLWTYLLFLQNFWTMTGSRHVMVAGPTWSLAIEEFFYLLAPLFLVGSSAKKIRWLTLLIIGAGVTYRSLLIMGVCTNPCGGIPSNIDTIAIGVLGASLVREPRLRAFLSQPWTRHCAIPILVALATMAAIPIASISSSLLSAWMPDVIAFLFLGLVLLPLAHHTSGFAGILSSRVLVGPGKYCYFIYLFHLVIIENVDLIFEGTPYFNMIAVRIIALAVLFMAAPLMWHLIERPLMRWARSKWPYVPSAPATAEENTSSRILEPQRQPAA